MAQPKARPKARLELEGTKLAERASNRGFNRGPLVLDASAVLAVLYGERGQKEIRARLRGVEAILSSVNLSEVAAKLSEGSSPEGSLEGEFSEGGTELQDSGFGAGEIRELVGALGLEIRPFDEEAALGAGLLRSVTRDRGLSLGDRACIAHARQVGGVALTLDKAWDGLDDVEVVSR